MKTLSINKMILQNGVIFFLLIGSCGFIDVVYAQITSEKPSIEIMVLGSAHFGNPGQDVINFEFPDVLNPEYQQQVKEVTDRLGEFESTKIALEARLDYKPKVDSMYRAYLKGEHELTRNERQQLGFRLAKHFNHPRVYSVDHEGEFPFETVMEYAEKHRPEFIHQFNNNRKQLEQRKQQQYNTKTVREILQHHNSQQSLSMQRNFYAMIASVGADTTWVGADLVSKWHERNIKIFAKLSQIAEPGDRIIVIFGSGHSPLLRYFVESDATMKLIDPLDYL